MKYFMKVSFEHCTGSADDGAGDLACWVSAPELTVAQVSVGHGGSEALEGEFISSTAIYSITPNFCPKPIAQGTFKSDANVHFYISDFYDFSDGVPEPYSFCKQLAKLHSKESPNGKFGFECTTYNGNLPQDNTWHDSWGQFFASGLCHILTLRE